MYKVFNRNALTRKERFKNALIAGIGTAVLIVVIYMLVSQIIAVPDFFYIPFGFAIGYAIQYFGHGVQMRFSVLAVVLTFISILVCDLIFYGGDLNMLVQSVFNQGMNTIYNVAYRGVALYLAFVNARIVKGR